MDPVSALDFEKGGGVVTAIAVDDASGDLLMVASMNEEALRRTLDTGEVHYWSRSRDKLWHKGEETEMTSFSTRVKSDAMYDINQYIANGATVTDFNLNEYTGDDYSPVYC